MVKDIDVLWDVVFVICMGNKYEYLVRDVFVIYMRNMYGAVVRYVICKIHGSMKDIEVKDNKDMRL